MMNPAEKLRSASLRRTLVRQTNVVPSSVAYAFSAISSWIINGLLPKFILLLLVGMLLTNFAAKAQLNELSNCNITWNQQSKNSGESMPCGGGDIGLNVWVEKGEVFFIWLKAEVLMKTMPY